MAEAGPSEKKRAAESGAEAEPLSKKPNTTTDGDSQPVAAAAGAAEEAVAAGGFKEVCNQSDAPAALCPDTSTDPSPALAAAGGKAESAPTFTAGDALAAFNSGGSIAAMSLQREKQREKEKELPMEERSEWGKLTMREQELMKMGIKPPPRNFTREDQKDWTKVRACVRVPGV
jgi:hypothetical protein